MLARLLPRSVGVVRHASRWTRSSQNPTLPAIPELFNANFLDELIPAVVKPAENEVSAPPKTNAMMDALVEFSHRTVTENGAATYDSTGSPTLDAFNGLTHYSYGEQVGDLLGKSWAEDPNLTLKIIWNLRSIHDGKSEKEGFYRAFGWLYDNHPRTAITNLHLLVEPVCSENKKKKDVVRKGLAHGYWKDLLNILALATVDQLSNIAEPAAFLHTFPPWHIKNRLKNVGTQGPDTSSPEALKARRAAAAVANQERVERKLEDPKYRALYVAVARLFAERLVADFRLLLAFEGDGDSVAARTALRRGVSLAPKWAPSLCLSHDRCTNIATAISRLVYHAKDTLPETRFPAALENHPALESAEATDIMRSFFRRWVLSPLRAAAVVTETLMSAGRWTDIPYAGVSSTCMKNNSTRFFERDPDGFQRYLIAVEKGDRSISGKTLLPHELIAQICKMSSPHADGAQYPELMKHRQEVALMQRRVVEAQWKTLVQNMRDAGTLDNAIAVCDVSGSMGSIVSNYCDYSEDTQPIFPAIALSLLLAQLAKPPFNNGFITFSARPEFVRLDPSKSLYDTVMRMNNSQWGMNTDLNAVFLRLLLPLAVANKVKPEEMIKRVFVFSDMQFDEASKGTRGMWETNYDVIARAFAENGYEVPQIVYWNLANYGTVETLAEQRGVAMMSGFSPSMLKVFMGEEDVAGEEEDASADLQTKVDLEFNPVNIMKKALSRESYAGLVVVD